MHILGISSGAPLDLGHWHAVLQSGIDAFMVREKALEAGPLLALTRWCQQQAPHVLLWVNGRLDVALAVACGLHAPEHYPLGAMSLPISQPLHHLTQYPARSGAHQLLLSPVFPTPEKGPALGVEGLHTWLDGLPSYGGRLLALGGIGPQNMASLKHPRLHGVALIRSLWEAAEPGRRVETLRGAWENA